jgi:hypothetical protein
MTAKKIKWAAKLNGVSEVTLLGAASLSYWREKLEKDGLRPLDQNGQAQVLIIAADAIYMGLRFTELSVSILVSSADSNINKQQAYLVHAFNSRRFFAFCERTLFATPYYFADVTVSSAVPASVEVVESATIIFRAAMSTVDTLSLQRKPTNCADGGWEGPVYLPSTPWRANSPRRLFFARLKGFIKTYPFLWRVDECLIRPRERHPVLESLIASEFVPKQWIIRNDAQHAKSKTYKRADVAG